MKPSSRNSKSRISTLAMLGMGACLFTGCFQEPTAPESRLETPHAAKVAAAGNISLSSGFIPLTQDHWIAGKNIILVATVIDPNLVDKIEFFRDNVKVGEILGYPVSGTTTWEFWFSYLEPTPGYYTYQAKRRDKDGSTRMSNLAQTFVWYQFTADFSSSLKQISETEPWTGVPFNVPAVPGVVREIRTTLDVLHTFDGDLQMEMRSYTQSPTVGCLIANRVGGSGDHFKKTKFRDDAVYSIQDARAVAPFNGTYKPAESFNNKFWGRKAAGSYLIYFRDLASQDIGYVQSVQVDIKIGP